MSWVLYLIVPLLCGLYIWLNDLKLLLLSPEAAAISPTRWSEEEVRKTYAKLQHGPKSLLEGRLPPKTGRRYIVVGGAGFLGGWIVLHLIQRGEDPRRIRVLDIRPPVRKDLQEGAAREVDFVQVDITDAKAVEAAFRRSWPAAAADVPGQPEPEITVFHTAAIIRFYERHPDLLPLCDRVNVDGMQNVLDATRKIGAPTFVYTSSGSVAVKASSFWLWPWTSVPKFFLQVINDDDTLLPKQHEQFFSNYAVSKLNAERRVRSANGTPSGNGTLRTGSIRPGNGIYGPGGDLLVGSYLAKKYNPSWIANVMQSFIHVENCSLAHLCYEQRLIELQRGSSNPDISGQAFCVADSGAPPTYGDVYDALTMLSNGETTFPAWSPTAMLGLAHMVEWYYLTRHFLLKSRFSFLGRLIPAIVGDIVFLQPSMFALTNVHIYFDDSRARATPEKGGLGYNQTVTTMEGVCAVVHDHHLTGGQNALRIPAGHVGTENLGGFPTVAHQQAVGDVIEKLEDTAARAMN